MDAVLDHLDACARAIFVLWLEFVELGLQVATKHGAIALVSELGQRPVVPPISDPARISQAALSVRLAHPQPENESAT